jgi:hypothetical protein
LGPNGPSPAEGSAALPGSKGVSTIAAASKTAIRMFILRLPRNFEIANIFLNSINGTVEFTAKPVPLQKGVPVNYAHLGLAFLGATVAYFVCGSILFAALPAMKSEFLKYPSVFRSQDGMMKVMPFNMVAILASILVVAVLYARLYPAGGGIASGLFLGSLVGIFAVCTFVIHNYVFLNIGLKLTVYEGVTYFIQWLIVGATIGLIYKP